MSRFKSLEICAGAGGQALGLEQAGFDHVALVEIEPYACKTLEINKPQWPILNKDIKTFCAKNYDQIDLFSGGVPCPPFSIAGKQLGQKDDRDLFPDAIRLIKECNPKAVLIENVKGILTAKFANYRNQILKELSELGYESSWQLINSSDYGVSQLRPRAILISMKPKYFKHFIWPKKQREPKTVGEILYCEMSKLGWENAENWKQKANQIAPTLVGGSKKHGGADLGPSRAKKAWAELGVEGKSLANTPPKNGFTGNPRLTLEMTALIQGFPKSWKFYGKKTPAYRQVGNAFPPPVAYHLGKSIRIALQNG